MNTGLIAEGAVRRFLAAPGRAETAATAEPKGVLPPDALELLRAAPATQVVTGLLATPPDASLPARPAPPPGPLPQPAGAIQSALNALVAYIPADILTLYVTVLALLQPGSNTGRMLVFVVFLILTPVIVWLVYAGKLSALGQPLPLAPNTWPWWGGTAASVSYFLWAATLPQSPLPWPGARVAGVMVLATAALLRLVEPLVRRP